MPTPKSFVKFEIVIPQVHNLHFAAANNLG
jgi:hypothetical protein